MKIIKISALLIVLLIASCDKEDNTEALEALAGHWHVLRFEPDSSSEIALMAKDVVEILEARGCDPLEFSFKSDGKVTYTDKMPLLNATSGEAGTEVECLWEGGSRSGTFDFDYDTLTMKFDNETVSLDASLENDFIMVQTNDLIINGQTVSGRLVYKRESGD